MYKIQHTCSCTTATPPTGRVLRMIGTRDISVLMGTILNFVNCATFLKLSWYSCSILPISIRTCRELYMLLNSSRRDMSPGRSCLHRYTAWYFNCENLEKAFVGRVYAHHEIKEAFIMNASTQVCSQGKLLSQLI